MAKLTFFGATEGVTGSAYLLETKSSRVLLECGLFQGRREEEKANQEAFPFEVRALDAVPYSARGICRALWNDDNRDRNYLGRWLALEIDEKKIGDFDEPGDYTARHLCRAYWSDGGRDQNILALSGSILRWRRNNRRL